MRMVDRRHHAFALGGASGRDGVLRVSAGARGLDIGFLKRRSPSTDQTLFLPMPLAPAYRSAPPRQVAPAKPSHVPAYAQNMDREMVSRGSEQGAV